MTEKVKLTLYVDKHLIAIARLFTDNSITVTPDHHDYWRKHPNRLNLSQFLTKALEQFFKQQNIDPSELLEIIHNNRIEGMEEWFRVNGEKAHEFWEGVKHRRAVFQRAKYEYIGKIIADKERDEWGSVDDVDSLDYEPSYDDFGEEEVW